MFVFFIKVYSLSPVAPPRHSCLRPASSDKMKQLFGAHIEPFIVDIPGQPILQGCPGQAVAHSTPILSFLGWESDLARGPWHVGFTLWFARLSSSLDLPRNKLWGIVATDQWHSLGQIAIFLMATERPVSQALFLADIWDHLPVKGLFIPFLFCKGTLWASF